MARIVWDEMNKRFFESGLDRGVLYIGNETVPWNGLSKVNTGTDGSEPSIVYIDGLPVRFVQSFENFRMSVNAYTYPDAFEMCNGYVPGDTGVYYDNQPRKPFHFSYRTLIHNETSIRQHYKIHLVYNAYAISGALEYQTSKIEPEVTDFAWTFYTLPSPAPNARATSHITIDTRQTPLSKLLVMENILYGTDKTKGRILFPDEIESIYNMIDLFISSTPSMDGVYPTTEEEHADIRYSDIEGVYKITEDTRLYMNDSVAQTYRVR